MQVNVPTSNKFSALTNSVDVIHPRDNENISKASQSPKKSSIKIPPIIKNQIQNYKVFNSQIKKLLQSEDYSTCFLRIETKLYVKTVNHFNMLKKEFLQEHMDYHTYTMRDECAKKVVLKASAGMDPEDIKK